MISARLKNKIELIIRNAFDEGKHPRGQGGQFGSGGSDRRSNHRVGQRVKILGSSKHKGKYGYITQIASSGLYHAVSSHIGGVGGKHLGYFDASDLDHGPNPDRSLNG